MRQFFTSLKYMLQFTYRTWRMFFAKTKVSKVPFWRDYGCVSAKFVTKSTLMARKLESKQSQAQNVVPLPTNLGLIQPKRRVLH